MPDEVVSLAYQNKFGVPWHYLGTPIFTKVTAVEAATLGGLNYQTCKVQMLSVMPDGSTQVAPSAAIYSNFGDDPSRWTHITTLRKDSDKYTTIDNMEIAALLDSGTEDQPALSEVFDMDVTGVLSEGRIAFFCLRMGEDTVKLGNDGDDHYVSHLIVRVDYNGGGAVDVLVSHTRVVCRNTDLKALQEAGEKKTLWRFPLRSDPMAWLQFRLSVERTAQASRRSYYDMLNQMMEVNWEPQDNEAFANLVFPMPTKPAKMQRQKYANLASAESVAAVQGQTDAAIAVYEDAVARTEANRLGLLEDIASYENEFGGGSLYAAYNGATQYISTRLEKGTQADVAASLLVKDRSRALELENLHEAVRFYLS